MVWWVACLAAPIGAALASSEFPITVGAKLWILVLATAACTIGCHAYGSPWLAAATATSSGGGLVVLASASPQYSPEPIVGCAILTVWFGAWSIKHQWGLARLISAAIAAAVMLSLTFPPDVLARSVNWWSLLSATLIAISIWIGPLVNQPTASVPTTLERLLTAGSDRSVAAIPLWMWAVAVFSHPATSFDPTLASNLGVVMGLGFATLAAVGAGRHHARLTVALVMGSTLLITFALSAAYSPMTVLIASGIQAVGLGLLAWLAKDSWAATLAGGYAIIAISAPAIRLALYG